MKASWKTALLAGAAMMLSAGVAVAQDTVPGTQDDQVDPTVSDEQAVLEDVVVTARRTEENLQRVPGSVSAFSERALERIGAQDPTGLQGAVPNLNIVQGRGSSNATNIYIRGVGQPDALQTFDPAVGVYVDDVYIARIRGTQFDLLDLERVEVLRGPQGTLYGKNTPGGALKLVSRKPGGEPRGQYSATFGSYGQAEARLLASAPLNDQVAVGISLLGAQRDGYVTDPVKGEDYNDRNTFAGRAALAFTPNERLRVDLSADLARDRASLTVGQATSTITTLFGTPILVLPATPPEYNFRTRTTPGLPNSTELDNWGVSAIVTYDLSEALTLKSITAYRQLETNDFIDIDATQLEIGDVLVAVDQDQTSQEFQLAYNQGPWQAVGGVFYLKEDVSSHQEAYADDLVGVFAPLGLFNPTFLRTIDDDLQTTSWAAYANATFSVTEALRVSAGIRYTHEEKDYFRTTSTFSTAPVLRGTFAFKAQDEWEDVSPMASIDYQAAENILLYGRVAKGFKSGGFNGRANNAGEEQPYDPETVMSYEAGVKTDWLDRRLRANFTVFTSTYEDFQARVSRSVTSPTQPVPSPDFAVLNAGELEISGAELEVTATPVTGLLLEAQVGYLDAKYNEFFEERLIGGVLTRIDRSFQEPAFSPDWTMRFAGQYEFTLGAARGQRFPGMFQEDYWLYDARLMWESPDRRWSATLFGRNLADEVYKTDAQEFSSVGNIRTAYYGAPRTYSLTLGFRY
jgi:iron complex outermembrane receptor protein